MSNSDLQSLIDACESEPIHIPGGIQPYGAMLVFSPYFGALQQASENAAEFFAVDSLWEASAHSLIDGMVLQQLHAALQFGERASVETQDRAFCAYVSGPYWVVEVEPLAAHAAHISVRQTLQRAIDALRAQQEPKALLQTLTEQVRRVSGFERIMVYQFDHDWHGQITAESTGQNLRSMLGHHFPASDIPPQARAMYSRNQFRIIGSAHQSAIAMQGRPGSEDNEPVDMSDGTLRAVSPIHMQYLQNLGVGASSSIGIFEEERLWGIVACHHTDSLWLPSKVREALTLMVEFASQRYFYLQQYASNYYQKRVHLLRDQMAEHDWSKLSSTELFSQHAGGWLNLLDASGCCYIEDEDILGTTGEVPSEGFTLRLTRWLKQHVKGRPYWSTRSIVKAMTLEDVSDDDAVFAGLLAVPMFLQGERASWLLFFRSELVELRNWAGKPEKEVYKGATGDMLGPRKSFSMWQQKVEGQSAPWQDQQLFAARDLARDLLIVADSSHLMTLNEALANANARLKNLAEQDDLTGLWNRRYAEMRLQEAQHQAQRYQANYSLLLLDLDHFKHINDQHGHNVGDRVLQRVCTSISELLRESDMFARWGGEEFVILATHTDVKNAAQFAERVRAAVESIDASDLPTVTVSIGISTFEPDDKTWDGLVERADKAMYRAKQLGRNRAITYDKDMQGQ